MCGARIQWPKTLSIVELTLLATGIYGPDSPVRLPERALTVTYPDTCTYTPDLTWDHLPRRTVGPKHSVRQFRRQFMGPSGKLFG